MSAAHCVCNSKFKCSSAKADGSELSVSYDPLPYIMVFLGLNSAPDSLEELAKMANGTTYRVSQFTKLFTTKD